MYKYKHLKNFKFKIHKLIVLKIGCKIYLQNVFVKFEYKVTNEQF